MELTLSEDDLTEAVTEWAVAKGHLTRPPGSKAPKITVEIEVSPVSTGYGQAERTDYVGTVVLREEG